MLFSIRQYEISHTVTYSGCINLLSHQQCKRVPSSCTSFLAFTVCRFLDDGHSDWCKVVLICISLVISDIQCLHVFIGYLYVFFGEMSVKVFCLFLIGLGLLFFFFLILHCMSCLYILEINPLSVVSFSLISALIFMMSFLLPLGALFSF